MQLEHGDKTLTHLNYVVTLQISVDSKSCTKIKKDFKQVIGSANLIFRHIHILNSRKSSNLEARSVPRCYDSQFKHLVDTQCNVVLSLITQSTYLFCFKITGSSDFFSAEIKKDHSCLIASPRFPSLLAAKLPRTIWSRFTDKDVSAYKLSWILNQAACYKKTRTLLDFASTQFSLQNWTEMRGKSFFLFLTTEQKHRECSTRHLTRKPSFRGGLYLLFM